MLSVVIPTLNSEESLPATLAVLVPAAVDGLVRQVILVDGGSTDGTRAIGDAVGADVVRSEPGRGVQLKAGAERARSPWLLFLHSDTVLTPGWEDAARDFMARVDMGERPEAAAAFRFALDDTGLRPRLLEKLVAARAALLRLPYGDQGLLISRRLYDRIGGYAPLVLMEDVDIVRRLGRRRVRLLPVPAVTSAARYRREGYLRRASRNALCLSLYWLRVPPRVLARWYAPRA
jgi:rSAM/selenodomain-associated transferase 2